MGPRTYSSILGHRLDQLTETLGKDNESLQELQSILTAISYLPPGTEVDPEKLEERKREKRDYQTAHCLASSDQILK